MNEIVIDVKKHNKRMLFIVWALAAGIAALALFLPVPTFLPVSVLEYMRRVGRWVAFGCVVAFIGYFVGVGFHHGLWRHGIKYAFAHTALEARLRRQMVEAGLYIAVMVNGVKMAKLGRIGITFDKRLQCGTVFIENHIKYHDKFDDLDISAALGRRWVLDMQYFDDSEDNIIFEFSDASADWRFYINSRKEAEKIFDKYLKNYYLVIDKRFMNNFPLSHILMTASTGGGKTYAVYTLVYMMFHWEPYARPELYFVDMKGSSLMVLGDRMGVDTATNTDEVLALLDRLYAILEDRKVELAEKLKTGAIDRDYRDFHMKPVIMIFDEYLDFAEDLAAMPAADRRPIDKKLGSIVRLGRQLGVFLWVLCQQSRAEDIPTKIRNNMIFTAVLGNPPPTTYQTAFGVQNVTTHKLGRGSGLYIYQGLTQKPSRLDFPTFGRDFDIVNEICAASGVSRKPRQHPLV